MSSIKVLPHGIGSGRRAVRYLLQALDSRGQPRRMIKVLKGDPAMTARLIDSQHTVQRYTSLVVAWHPEDRPTEAQMRTCLDELIELMCGGLDADRLDVLAVMHDGHFHVVMPRVDLLTGKSYNPAPPGWERAYGALRDAWNYEHNWARPDDPARARPLQPGRVPPIERDPRILMTRSVEDALLAGEITDRAGVVRVLKAHGEITRQGRDSVSVTLPTIVRPVRLKGPIFARELDADAVRAAVARHRAADAPQPSGCGVDAATARGRAHLARQALAEAVKRRQAYTATRYRQRPAPETIPAWSVEDPDHFAARQRAMVEARLATRKPVAAPPAPAIASSLAAQPAPVDRIAQMKVRLAELRTASLHAEARASSASMTESLLGHPRDALVELRRALGNAKCEREGLERQIEARNWLARVAARLADPEAAQVAEVSRQAQQIEREIVEKEATVSAADRAHSETLQAQQEARKASAAVKAAEAELKAAEAAQSDAQRRQDALLQHPTHTGVRVFRPSPI